MSEDTVLCWKDVMSVMRSLWEFRGRHYVHNDVHTGQVVRAEGRDGVLRCHVIDFGRVLSLDQTKSGISGGAFANPFWCMELRSSAQRAAYVRKHGTGEFYKRGWEFSVSR